MRDARYIALQVGAVPFGGERLSSELGLPDPLMLLPRLRDVSPGDTFSGRYLDAEALADMLALRQIARVEDLAHG